MRFNKKNHFQVHLIIRFATTLHPLCPCSQPFYNIPSSVMRSPSSVMTLDASVMRSPTAVMYVLTFVYALSIVGYILFHIRLCTFQRRFYALDEPLYGFIFYKYLSEKMDIFAK